MANVLSTQRRWVALSGAPGEIGPPAVAATTGAPDEAAGEMAPHAFAVMASDRTPRRIERGVMAEYTFRGRCPSALIAVAGLPTMFLAP